MTGTPHAAVHLCLACGQPTDATAAEPGQAWRCDCEPDVAAWRRAQQRERSEPWHLCVLCARDYAPLRSRWSWLACPACLEVNTSIGRTWGRDLQLPLGRHSLMNGASIPLADLDEDRLRDRIGTLVQLTHNWRTLYQWRDAEFARVAATLPAAVRAHGRVPVRDYPILAAPSPQRSQDAWLRCRGITSLHQLDALRTAVDDAFPART